MDCTRWLLKRIILFILIVAALSFSSSAYSVNRTFHFTNQENFTNIVYSGGKIAVSYQIDTSEDKVWAVDDYLPEGWSTEGRSLSQNRLRFFSSDKLNFFNFSAPKILTNYTFNGSYYVERDEWKSLDQENISVMSCNYNYELNGWEICNGVDDNCNYFIDEGKVCNSRCHIKQAYWEKIKTLNGTFVDIYLENLTDCDNTKFKLSIYQTFGDYKLQEVIESLNYRYFATFRFPFQVDHQTYDGPTFYSFDVFPMNNPSNIVKSNMLAVGKDRAGCFDEIPVLVNMSIFLNESTTLSEKFDREIPVLFKMQNKTYLDFRYDCRFGKINLTNFSIVSRNESFGYTYVKGLDITNKTLYIDKVKSSNLICIKDYDIETIGEYSDTCNKENETILNCPESKNGYSCEIINGTYVVYGLKHSGVKEIGGYCGDGYTPCANQGGTGGSGGGRKIELEEKPCTEYWTCFNWLNCEEFKAGDDKNQRGFYQQRECVDRNNCGTSLLKPVTERTCIDKGKQLSTSVKTKVEEKITGEIFKLPEKTIISKLKESTKSKLVIIISMIITLIATLIASFIVYYFIGKRRNNKTS